jgi:hypothetical protein
VAVKLARAKARVQRLRGSRHLSVVFAVYKEHQRILPRSEHEIGEDFLRRKLRQLEWQFDCSPEFGWDLSVVDDGCPEGSGAIADGDPQTFDACDLVDIEDLRRSLVPACDPGAGDS